MVFEVPSFQRYSKADLLALLVECYFTTDEQEYVHTQRASGVSYTEAVNPLATHAQNEFRRRPCCLTIPGGYVLAFPPNRPAGDLSYIAFELRDIVQAVFPPLEEAAQEGTLWGPQAPLFHQTRTGEQPLKKRASTRGRVCFELVRGKKNEETWVARTKGKDLGLGYQIKRLSDHNGYWIELLHLPRHTHLTSVILFSQREDHDRIHEWVKTCLQLADWTHTYPMLLRQQPAQRGRLKRQVLAQRLERLWQNQEKQVRQQLLFGDTVL